jgi:hypothetical protein
MSRYNTAGELPSAIGGGLGHNNRLSFHTHVAMDYDLMLLADPGPHRAEVLRVFAEAADLVPHPGVETRFALRLPGGEAKVNIGTKDPVESVHVEFSLDDLALCEAATLRALDLADALGMRVEDVQWGKEIERGDLPELRAHWEEVRHRIVSLGGAAPSKKPWWKPW